MHQAPNCHSSQFRLRGCEGSCQVWGRNHATPAAPSHHHGAMTPNVPQPSLDPRSKIIQPSEPTNLDMCLENRGLGVVIKSRATVHLLPLELSNSNFSRHPARSRYPNQTPARLVYLTQPSGTQSCRTLPLFAQQCGSPPASTPPS